MRIIWSDEALADLASALDHLEKESDAAADLVDQRIREAGALLERFPMMGRAGRIQNTREFVVQRTSYVLAYELDAEVIRVLRLLHAARLWPRTAVGLRNI